jgi:hypothetical protein
VTTPDDTDARIARLRERGYLGPAPSSEWQPPTAPASNGHREAPGSVTPIRPRATPEFRPFSLVDLAALAEAGVPPPELLCSGALYRGGVHSLAGPPDCGKSTLLYLWALQLLAQGETVMLVDEESGREQAVEKLVALGAEPRHLRNLAYVEFPGRQWDAADLAGFRALLAELRPALVGFDSASAFLALADRDEDRAPDVSAFYKGVLLAIAREFGAAVVVLDHVTKEAKGGRYARGSGAKLALVDVAIMVDPIRAFSRSQAGLLKLTVTKDRRGYLHRNHEARVEVEGGQMALTITQTSPDADEGELAGLGPAAVKILDALRAGGAPMPVRDIVDGVADRHGHGLRRPTVSTALNELAERGLVDCAKTTGDHGEKYWSAVTSPETTL